MLFKLIVLLGAVLLIVSKSDASPYLIPGVNQAHMSMFWLVKELAPFSDFSVYVSSIDRYNPLKVLQQKFNLLESFSDLMEKERKRNSPHVFGCADHPIQPVFFNSLKTLNSMLHERSTYGIGHCQTQRYRNLNRNVISLMDSMIKWQTNPNARSKNDHKSNCVNSRIGVQSLIKQLITLLEQELDNYNECRENLKNNNEWGKAMLRIGLAIMNLAVSCEETVFDLNNPRRSNFDFVQFAHELTANLDHIIFENDSMHTNYHDFDYQNVFRMPCYNNRCFD